MTASQERSRLIDEIRRLPEQLVHLTEGLGPGQLTGHFLAGEWSVAQNVHHLADSHINSYLRCRLILTEEEPTLKPYDQDRWAALPDAQTADISASLALLEGLHARWVGFWQALGPQDWQRTGFHPENGLVTLEDQLRLYAAHGLGHIDQIQRTLSAQYASPPGSKEELLERIEGEWARLNRQVDRLAPEDFERAGAGGWTPKVQLAHIAAWESLLLRHYLGGEPAHAAMRIDAGPWAAADMDGINAILFEMNEPRPLAEVQAEFQEVHAATLEALVATSWQQLLRPLRENDPERRPLLDWVIGNTYEHYLEHAQSMPVV